MARSKQPFFLLAEASVVTALAVNLGGCVAAKHYDEARSVAESEMAGHQETRARLVAALDRAKGLEAELSARSRELEQQSKALEQKSRALDAGEVAVAESKLEATVLSTEKRAAGELLDQLRSELARTGEHMGVFTREKRDLQQALLLAEKRLLALEAASRGMDEIIGAARDLGVGLGTAFEESGATLGARDGGLCLSIPAAKLFAPGGETLNPTVMPLVAAVARASAAHPGLSLVLAAPDGTPRGAARLGRLAAALREGGVSESRLVLPVTSLEPTAPAPAADETALPAAEAALAVPAPEPLPASPGDAPADNAIEGVLLPAVESPPSLEPGRFEILFKPS